MAMFLPHPRIRFCAAIKLWRMPRLRRAATEVTIAEVVTEVAMRLDSGASVGEAWMKTCVVRGIVPETKSHANMNMPEHQRALSDSYAHSGAEHRLALAALRRRMPGNGVVDSLEAAVRFSQLQGAPLSDVLRSVARSLHDAQQAESKRRIALAGPRASARILSVLPLAGMAVGWIVGARPLEVFADGAWGSAVACAGAFFMAVGWIWVRRLVAQAEGAG